MAVTVAANVFDPESYAKADIIVSDVVVVGGGSSGTYAAINLGKMGQSVVIVEKKKRLGGHTNTYTDDATGLTDITNTGKHTGSEVAQLYVEFLESEEEPPKLLRGFTKIKNMEPGHRRKASFPIRQKDVMIWDVIEQKWRFPKGESVKFHVGSSSRNLPLKIAHSLSL